MAEKKMLGYVDGDFYYEGRRFSQSRMRADGEIVCKSYDGGPGYILSLETMVTPAEPFDKPAFKDDQRVEVTLEGDGVWLPGRIRGISSSHLIDMWIVELDEYPSDWKFKCITVPHTFIKLK